MVKKGRKTQNLENALAGELGRKDSIDVFGVSEGDEGNDAKPGRFSLPSNSVSPADAGLMARRSVMAITSPYIPLVGKGWHSVSTRNWIRNFRSYLPKFYTLPYVKACKILFLSIGFYPDWVDQESYQKFIYRFPISTRRGSWESDMVSGMSSIYGTSRSSTTLTSRDSNANLIDGGGGRKSLAQSDKKHFKSIGVGETTTTTTTTFTTSHVAKPKKNTKGTDSHMSVSTSSSTSLVDHDHEEKTAHIHDEHEDATHTPAKTKGRRSFKLKGLGHDITDMVASFVKHDKEEHEHEHEHDKEDIAGHSHPAPPAEAKKKVKKSILVTQPESESSSSETEQKAKRKSKKGKSISIAPKEGGTSQTEIKEGNQRKSTAKNRKKTFNNLFGDNAAD